MKQHTITAPHAELLSALVDGQLASSEYEEVFAAFERDPLSVNKWNTYHLIGDALRSSESVGEVADTAFVERLQKRLSRDSLLLPVAGDHPAGMTNSLVVALKAGRTSGPVFERSPAANDGTFRWKALAGLASLVAVGAIAWSVVGVASRSDAPQLAQVGDRSNDQVLVASPQGPIVRDVRLEEFLAAHRQLGSTSAVQMPSGFLRNAAFETPQSAGR
jgi:sigma-E factor negative regulatory protein RseA